MLRRTRTALFTALFLAAAIPAFAASSWNIDTKTSKLTWAVAFNKQPVSGEFQSWNGQIAFDPADLKTSSISINISLASVNSQDANRDTTLKGADFFNIAKTPTATFTSTKISATPQGYVADGTLSLAGITKPVSVPFTVTINGGKAVAHGKLQLSRSQFGVGKGQWASASEIADSVEVTFTVNADMAPKSNPNGK